MRATPGHQPQSAEAVADDAVFPPLPDPTALTRFFWDGARRHELRLLRCQRCGTFIHLPRPVCRSCWSTELASEALSGRATLYSYTVVEQAFHPFFADKLPYVLAVVAPEEDPSLRLTTNIVDCPVEHLRVGLPVEATFAEVAPELTLPLFRPAS